ATASRTPPSSTLSLHDALPILPRRGRRGWLGGGTVLGPRVLGIAPAQLAAQRRVMLRPEIFQIARHLHGAPVRRQQVDRERDARSEEHTSELQSLRHLVCRLLL